MTAQSLFFLSHWNKELFLFYNLSIYFLRERSRGLQLTGLDWKCFLCPAKNVSVMEYCGGKRVTLAYLENEPEKISERQSKE